jgi:uncharacterized protein YdgA (DUF945 family)
VKKLVIAAALLLIIVLVAPGIAGKLLKQGQVAEIARVSESNPDINIALKEIDSRWFSSDYQYSISFILPGEEQPTTLDFNATHFHGPVSIGALASGAVPQLGMSSYTWTAEVFAQLAEATADSDPEASEFLRHLPDLSGSGVVGFDGGTSGQALLEGFTMENESGSISSSDIILHLTTNANGEAESAAITIDRFYGYSTDFDGESVIELNNLAVDFAATASLGGMPIGDGQMQLGKLIVKSTGIDFEVQQLSSSSKVDRGNDLLSYAANLDLDGLSYNGLNIGSSSVQASYNGLHLPTLLEMQEINARFVPPADATEDEMMALLIQQGEASQRSMLELLLYKPALKSQWDIAVFEDNAKLAVDINLNSLTDELADAMRQNPAMGLLQMAGVVAGTLELALPQKLVNNGATYYLETQAAEPMTAEQKQHTAVMMSQIPVRMGYMVDDNGTLKATIQLANGETTLNGQPFALLQLISQYASQFGQDSANP